MTSIIEIPSSKSFTNRALILAALTEEAVTLHNPLYCDDTNVMIHCLRQLGLRIETFPSLLIVHDHISIIKNNTFNLFVENSGTTFRFLIALACLIPGTKIIQGHSRLNERPIHYLIDALRSLGAKIDYLKQEGQAPVIIHSSSLLQKSEITLDSSMSSQFLSAMLLISPLLGGVKIRLINELISEPYITMTTQVMREWGVNVWKVNKNCYEIPPSQHYQKREFTIEGDFSSACYFFALATLTQSKLIVKNLNPHSTQADRKFLDILSEMGNTIILHNNEIVIEGKQILPRSLNMKDCPDQVQTMAILAAFAKGITRIDGVRSLRVKETERVQALKNELGKMDIKTEDTYDSLTIFGGNPQSATIETYGDHRMAMAFAVASAKLPHMRILNPEVVNKTFPNFWEKFHECIATTQSV